jgi:hypothetical protein
LTKVAIKSTSATNKSECQRAIIAWLLVNDAPQHVEQKFVKRLVPSEGEVGDMPSCCRMYMKMGLFLSIEKDKFS